MKDLIKVCTYIICLQKFHNINGRNTIHLCQVGVMRGTLWMGVKVVAIAEAKDITKVCVANYVRNITRFSLQLQVNTEEMLRLSRVTLVTVI